MKTYYIKRGNGENWDNVPALSIDELLWSEPLEVAAYAQICCDNHAFYIHLGAEEEDIRAEEHGVTGTPCEDSCLEFFFCPMEGDHRYFNMEFNPNACMFLGFGSSIDDLVRLQPKDSENIFQPKPIRVRRGWEISYRIPFDFIRRFFPSFAAKSGCVIRANCYKCGDLTENPHFLSWNPVKGNKPDFHRPSDFGRMILE